MYTAYVATAYKGDGTPVTNVKRPAFLDDYPGIGCEDICGIPSGAGLPSKNIYICRVTVPDSMVATITAAASDARYQLLWNERTDDTDGHVVSGNRQSTLTGPQLAAIKSFLTARGYVAGDLSGVSLPITREDAATALVALFRNAT